MKLYAEKAKKAWALKMKNLKINESNLMIKPTTDDVVNVGSSGGVGINGRRDFVFKDVGESLPHVDPVTNKVIPKPHVDPMDPVKPTKVLPPKLIEKPKDEFTLIKQGVQCHQYKQLSIQSQSVETCSEQVRHEKGCASGHGHFFYGEVNANHKECSCCIG